MHRRRFLVAAATGGTVLSAGCLGGVVDDLTTHVATPATVADEVLERTGYERRETEERVREVTIRGESVALTNYLARFRRSVDLPLVGEVEAGAFGALTTPRVSIIGRELNPIGDMDRRELAGEVRDQYPELEVGEYVDEREAAPGGSTETVSTFEGEATVGGHEVPALVDICRFEREENHVVTVGIYPEGLPEEAERVTTMMEGVELEG